MTDQEQHPWQARLRQLASQVDEAGWEELLSDLPLGTQDALRSLAEQPVDSQRATFVPEGISDLISADGSASGESHQASDRVGPYKLLQPIGEGGMGTVYMAEQVEPFQRRVALKVIKAGMDSKQIIARFEAERQALALMDHQNIATVLDAGSTTDGRPYFVMELVRGLPITRYCDDNKLPIVERLNLFISVCNAVHHAHRRGIIHRDLKPSNVLVTQHDGEAVAKVIDFGLAKAIQRRLTEKTMFTEFGQVVGTLEYMSPEQSEMNALDVDTRSDVYSLGVLLYELLTGTTPLQRERVRREAFDQILRTIREEEPPRPSVRLSGSGEAPAISAQRRIESGKLTDLLRGDLDWIAMRALEKDRSRRYDTANGLAQDVERFLADEPIEARPPTIGYRISKLVSRHRRAAAAVTIGSVLILAACAITAYWGIRATLAESRLRKQAADAIEFGRTEQKLRERAEEAEAEARSQVRIADRLRYASDIRHGHSLLQQGKLFEGFDVLSSTDPQLRGWEYDWLHAQFHPWQTSLAALSPSFVCAQGWVIQDKTSVHVQAASGDRRTWLYTGDLTAIAVPENGPAVGVARDGFRGLRWTDLASGRELGHVVLPPDFSLRDAQLSPDGQSLAYSVYEDTDGYPSTLHLCATSDGTTINRWRADSFIDAFRFSADGQLLAVQAGNELHVFDTNKRKEVSRFRCPYKQSLTFLSEETIVTVDDNIELFDLRGNTISNQILEPDLDGELVLFRKPTREHWDHVTASHDGTYIACEDFDGRVQVFRLDDENFVLVDDFSHVGLAAQFAPSSNDLFVVGHAGRPGLRHIGSDDLVRVAETAHETVCYEFLSDTLLAAAHPDGRITTLALDGTVQREVAAPPAAAAAFKQYDGEDERLVTTRHPHRICQFSPRREELAVAGCDGAVRIYSRDLSLLHEFTASTEPIVAVNWSSTGGVLTVAGNQACASWSNDGSQLATIDLEGHYPRDIIPLESGELAVLCREDVKILDRESLNIARSLPVDGFWHLTPLCGSQFVTSASNDSLRIADALSGQVTNLDGHKDQIFQFGVSPDRERLFSFAEDQLYVWDTSNGSLLVAHTYEWGSLFGHWARIAFSPSGKSICICGRIITLD